MDQRTLLFSDIVDSTKVVQRLGDAAAAALWGEHDLLARALLAEHGGLEIDRSDGFFLLFDDVASAARFAVGYHATMAALELAARVGIHHGPVTLRQNPPQAVARGAKAIEVEGLAKPLAARVMSLAAGGQTLLSGEAASAVPSASLPGLELRSHGHYRLKGIEDPLALFELGDERCGFVPPADVDKAYRVVADGDLWRPAREIRHNLAPERDTFVGRSAELSELAAMLENGARLVSVLGVGGTGKTRLVRRYARAWLGDWPGGIYFCDLSEARSLEGICFAVASALEVPLGKGDPVVQLGHAIAARDRCLVLLDNFEQVVELAPSTLGRWLDRAEEATFVVTTRERLRLPGEGVLAIEPLRVDSEAIDLFAVRAKAHRAGFSLDGSTRAPVAEIVKLLDGLPLAIELAAARIRVLSPHQIVARLRDRFVLLAGARGAAARQATLKAAIDWSWELLVPWEQAALAQCSVFEGGFTLEAAESVIDLGSWQVAMPTLDVVQALVDKSLLRSLQPRNGERLGIAEPWFGMYISVHDYAVERLRADPGGLASAQKRHGDFYASLGSDSAIDALQLHPGSLRQRLEVSIENLVAACRRALARRDADVAVDCLRAAWEVLDQHGPISVGAELAAAALAVLSTPSDQRARALQVAGAASTRRGATDEAVRRLLESRAWASQSGSLRLAAEAELRLGTVTRLQGRLEASRAHHLESISLARAGSDRLGLANAMLGLANVDMDQGLLLEATDGYEAVIALRRQIDPECDLSTAIGNLGAALFNRGDLDRARVMLVDAIELARAGGRRETETKMTCVLANLAKGQGSSEEAVALYRGVLEMARHSGDRWMEAMVFTNLGGLLEQRSEYEEARRHFEPALAIFREVGDQPNVGVVLHNLGNLMLQLGRLEQAEAFVRDALASHRATGNRRHEGATSGLLGEVLCRRGDSGGARAAIETAQSMLHEANAVLLLADAFCRRGRIELSLGVHAEARAALGRAEQLAREANVGANSPLGQNIESLRASIHSAASAG